jgi:hypothetical protein
VRIEELFGPIRLQILSEESDEIVVRHGFRSRDLAYGDMVSNTIWHTIVNIFDKPKRYSVTLDRGSDDSVNQFESHQLEKWIKPIINAYIERRERKFFLYVLDNNSTLELYEKNLTFPLIQYDYRPFITRVINECIHPLEFHESREDGQYVDDFLKAIDICRHLVI